jgi:mono/diheme cytochrome c family protein
MSAENAKHIHGYMAEFTSVDALLAACRRVRDAGYTKTDAYTPFPVHGIDEALGIKPTALPWIALGGGLTGTITAISMQIWMNGINYQYIISGKPYISLPAFIPVTFELTILLASFGAFFGMLLLNKLPCFSNPVFTNSRFDGATDDKFFLYIASDDPRFKADGVKRLLTDAGGGAIDAVMDDGSSDKLPRAFVTIAGVLAMLSIVPLLVAARMRVTNSSSPRFHIFYDMDFSPAKDAQKSTTLFNDGRAMRTDVPGTVIHSSSEFGPDYYSGIDVDALAKIDPVRAQRLVRFNGQIPQDGEPVADEPVTPPADEPVPPPADEPVTPPADEPVTPPADEPVTPPADEPVTPPADEPVTPPADEPVTPPADEPVTPPADEPVPPPADEPVPPPADEPVPPPADAPVTPPADEPVTPPADEPVTPPADEPVAPPADEPVTPPADAPVTPPAVEAVTPPAAPVVVDTTPWLKENPLEVTRETLENGQAQFNIYCAVCHGQDGRGRGLVNERAQKIQATSWVPPSSMHQPQLYDDKYPDGKLFSTISNGIRKMPGYSSQIKAADRWAIVAYVRALQLSQNASEEDVPLTARDAIVPAP